MAEQRYEAVVVGSGPDGLAAAITLVERGLSVLVLEAQDRLGGAVTTQELTLPGFHHDVFSAVHPAALARARPLATGAPRAALGARRTLVAAFVAPYLRHFNALLATMLASFPPVAGPARLLAGLGPSAVTSPRSPGAR